MQRVIFEQVVDTDYGQFTLLWGDDMWDGDADRFFAGQENGWVAASVPTVVHVVMARQYGGSDMRIESWAEEPPLGDEWEDVVEVSFTVRPGAEVRWETWAAENGGPLDIAPANYRLRANARGRDAGHAQEDESVIPDHYLLQFWPAEPAPDAVIRTTSAEAAYWNGAWGSRR